MFNLSNIKNKKLYILVIGLILVFIIAIVIINNLNKDEVLNSKDEILIRNVSDKSNESKNEDTDEIIIIHVTGEVAKSGIVKLKEGARIEDAIEAAGGLTENSDISDVNLAYVLEDGSKLNIPSKNKKEIDKDENIISMESGNIIDEKISNLTNSNEQNSRDNKKVNINKASKEQLENLPGIGSALAERIITYRNENGKFNSIEDLKNVSGIGESKFESLKDYISVK